MCELEGPTPILKRSKTLQTKISLLPRAMGRMAVMTRVSDPFVLLDDARPGGRATLYSGLRDLVETRDPAEVEGCLERLRGRQVAGFLAYEAGHALEPRLAPLQKCFRDCSAHRAACAGTSAACRRPSHCGALRKDA